MNAKRSGMRSGFPNIAGISCLLALLVLVAAAAGCTSAPVPASTSTPTPGPTATTITVTQTSSPAPAPLTPSTPAYSPTPIFSPSSNPVTDFVGAVQQVMPSVVKIEVTFGPQGAPNDPQAQAAAGTGWVIRSDGIIVTNNHVVDGARTVTVTLSDGSKYTATAVQGNPGKDLAVVKIAARNLPAVTTGDSSQLNLGQPVAAIGNALNLGIGVTVGVVSQLDVSANYNNVSLTGLIQTDATINPGNSGGVLININGEVVGIPNGGLQDPSLDVENFSYAISVNTAMPIINSLIAQLP